MKKRAPVTIGIASGRPGAGRTTVGVNLAAALAAMGKRVGITDTETAGPVIPEALGGGEPSREGTRLVPRDRYGVRVMSFAYLIEESERNEGRIPSMPELAARFERVVRWNALDVVFIDLPSTEDDIRALTERLQLDGAVLVATPRGAQEGATESAVAVFRRIGVPLLGLIENLSYYQCRRCGRRDPAEASGAGEALARRLGVRYLGALPLSIALRDCMDENRPAMACEQVLPEADLFSQVAAHLTTAAFEERRQRQTGGNPERNGSFGKEARNG